MYIMYPYLSLLSLEITLFECMCIRCTAHNIKWHHQVKTSSYKRLKKILLNFFFQFKKNFDWTHKWTFKKKIEISAKKDVNCRKHFQYLKFQKNGILTISVDPSLHAFKNLVCLSWIGLSLYPVYRTWKHYLSELTQPLKVQTKKKCRFLKKKTVEVFRI